MPAGGTLADDLGARAGRVDCFTCHNQWTTNCFGCHVVRDDRQRAADALAAWFDELRARVPSGQ